MGVGGYLFVSLVHPLTLSAWSSALQNVKELMKTKKRYDVKDSLLNEDGSGIKARPACFEVSTPFSARCKGPFLIFDTQESTTCELSDYRFVT